MVRATLAPLRSFQVVYVLIISVACTFFGRHSTDATWLGLTWATELIPVSHINTARFLWSLHILPFQYLLRPARSFLAFCCLDLASPCTFHPLACCRLTSFLS